MKLRVNNHPSLKTFAKWCTVRPSRRKRGGMRVVVRQPGVDRVLPYTTTAVTKATAIAVVYTAWKRDFQQPAPPAEAGA